MRAAALAAALTAAAFLPGERLGVAVPVVAALMLAALAGARLSPLQLGLGALALALAAQAALLDATWVVAIDLVAAWLLAALAAGGLSLAAVAAPLLRLRAAPDLAPRPTRRQLPLLRGAGLGVLVVAPFLFLFLSADAAFAGIAGDLPLPSGWSLTARLVTLGLVLAGAVGLGLAARAGAPPASSPVRRRLSFAEYAIPLALLDLLFAAFVAVQLTVLFGGNRRVLETEGLTYAEYARTGFWQLLAATVLTFVVVGAALVYARPGRRAERLAFRALLCVLCGLSLVVLVSALHRLDLYEEAFGLTRARLLAEAVALWLGVLLLLVAAAALSRAARRRLAPATVLATSLGLLAFSLGSPDLRVAERNVDRWRETGRLDLEYLADLSADAVPALLELPEPQRSLATAPLRQRLAEPDPLGSKNRSRARARALLGV